jgi:hypothetical protein
MVSRNRMRFLNRLKRSTNFSEEFLHYINKYNLNNKNPVNEAKKRERTMGLFYPLEIKLRECVGSNK